MPPIKGQMLKYSEQQMQNALADVSRGIPVATAAKHHGTPRITLLYKSKGESPNFREMGPESFLTREEESVLVEWIISVGRVGFHVTKDQLLNSVRNLVEQSKRKTPLKNNRPGRNWYKSFLKRHPEISTRVAQNLTSSRANVTQQQLLNWFEEPNNHIDILNNSSRVFNAYETAFFLNPKGNKVLTRKGDKTIHQKVNNDGKKCLTLSITGNASGDLAPPKNSAGLG
ncbi:hypothetical protein JTB14_008452 [Gonioctena quinquepunctata]|nr:hypothetical protein JTB14_008452 [Gonioctena quinquepunctata]